MCHNKVPRNLEQCIASTRDYSDLLLLEIKHIVFNGVTRNLQIEICKLYFFRRNHSHLKSIERYYFNLKVSKLTDAKIVKYILF